jgi:hypothetical protein
MSGERMESEGGERGRGGGGMGVGKGRKDEKDEGGRKVEGKIGEET